MLSFRVAGVPEHFNFPWHMAIESGALSTAGFNVKWTDFGGGTGAMMRSLRQAESDIAIVLTQGAVAEILRGNPSKIVKTFVDSPLVWGIHVKADSSIETIDQIQGQTYAISRQGSGSHLMSIVDAAERGWSPDSPRFAEVGGLDGAREAIANDTAQVFFWEKSTTDPYVENGEFRLLDIRTTIWPAFVVCVRDEVLQRHADQLKQLLTIVDQQCFRLKADDNAINKVSTRYGLDAAETEQWFSATSWCKNFEMPSESLATVIRYLNQLGIVDDSDAIPDDVWFQL